MLLPCHTTISQSSCDIDNSSIDEWRWRRPVLQSLDVVGEDPLLLLHLLVLAEQFLHSLCVTGNTSYSNISTQPLKVEPRNCTNGIVVFLQCHLHTVFYNSTHQPFLLDSSWIFNCQPGS